MAAPNEPVTGDWYRDLEGSMFEIVAVDERGQSVEIQYFDGDLEEVDLNDWYEMDLEPVAEPEDWSGPYDNLVADDFGDTDAAMRPEDWSGPLGDLDRE